MKGSRKGSTPPMMQMWLDQASDEWQPSYPFDSSEVRDEVRLSLLLEQRGLCVYCGRRLNLTRPGETYHVEHFRPQREYLHLAADYSNLFLSCGQKDQFGGPSQTCGAKKASWFHDVDHVVPAYPECTRRFRFRLNGCIEPSTDGDNGAINMIEKIRLDHPELVKDRSDILMLIDGGDLTEMDFWQDEDRVAQSYAHMVFQHLGLTLP